MVKDFLDEFLAVNGQLSEIYNGGSIPQNTIGNSNLGSWLLNQ